jgi:DNA helicase-2/ATP-dependent DNA helicase PcrA
VIRGHAYLLGAPQPLRIFTPHDERARRNGARDEDPEWAAERERLFLSDGLITFDLFAPKALALMERCNSLCRLIASRYPLIIVDEAQDTGTEQWACIEILAALSQVMCLADLDQQIYDFRPDVCPERVGHILKALKPLEIDLGIQNNRSPGVEVVKFGNDILANTPRGSAYVGVSKLNFRPNAAFRDKAIRSAIGMLRKQVESISGQAPESIGYLTNWGKGVTTIARALQGGDGVNAISHRVVMDEAEVLLATRVVALCLEPLTHVWISLAVGLDLIADLYRARGGATNLTKAERLSKSASDARDERIRGNAKCPKAFKGILENLQTDSLVGNPGNDWLTVRGLLEASETEELKLVARQVIYLMGFNRGRRIADALAEAWIRKGSYENARGLIEAVLTEDQILGSDGGLAGINVMTMHKSKGKEFDGVIILHLGNNMSPLSRSDEDAPHTKSRRLLRVAVTRARHSVLLLTDAYSPSPLLVGHSL